MTVKELSNLFNVSDETIKRVIRELFPGKMQNGKKTNLNKKECFEIGEKVRKQGYVQPIQNEQVELQFGRIAEVELQQTQNDYVELIKQILEPILKQQNEFNLKLINEIREIKNNQKQIEIRQDYYSIKAYCIKIGIKKISVSNMRAFGKEAVKLSKENNYEIKSVDDEQWGKVGSYHINVLKMVFEL
jgi:hypothetical protein